MPSEESGFLGIGSDYEYEVNDEESAIRMGHLKGDSETIYIYIYRLLGSVTCR